MEKKTFDMDMFEKIVMNEKTMADNIETVTKSDWDKREFVAEEQELRFKDINKAIKNELSTQIDPSTKESVTEEEITKIHMDYVERIILKWHQINETGKKVAKTLNNKGNNTVKVDMKKVVSTNKGLNGYIKEIIDEMIALSTSKSQSNNYISSGYIYVVCRNDGMVAAVGKSSFFKDKAKDKVISCGDLFSQLNLNGLSGTEQIIVRLLVGNDVANTLTDYYKSAWVIPIAEELANEPEYYEKSIGNYLISKGIPILNYYSHKL